MKGRLSNGKDVIAFSFFETARDRLAAMHWIPLAILALLFVFLIIQGEEIRWMPWTSDCNKNPACYPGVGETVSSIAIGRLYLADGPRYWFVQRASDGFFYTHNVSLGAFLYYLSALAVPDPLPFSVVLTLLGFCTGLYYGYLFVQRISGSALFGLIFLILMAGEYYFNLPFAYNLIRGWHWLALFGGAYHLLRSLEGNPRVRRYHAAAFVLYAIMGFMIGYDFLVTPFFLSLFLAATIRRANESFRLWPRLGGIFAAYALPFALRQAQIIGALGFGFWTLDLYYSAVIKTSFLSAAFPLPPLSAIDSWYRQHHVFRPFALPYHNPMGIGAGFVHYLSLYWAPYLDHVTLWVVMIGIILAVALVAFAHMRGMTQHDLVPLVAASRVVIMLSGAEVLGLYFFAPLSVEIYVNHRFPLLIGALFLAYAFVIYAPIVLFRIMRSWGQGLVANGCRIGVVALLIFLVLYRGAIVVSNYHQLALTGPPAGTNPAHLDATCTGGGSCNWSISK